MRIRLIELMDHVLSTYDRAISSYTAETFKRNGIELVLNSRVQSVGTDSVTVVDTDGKVRGGGVVCGSSAARQARR